VKQKNLKTPPPYHKQKKPPQMVLIQEGDFGEKEKLFE
jgi:hypothetical protein